MQPIVEKKQKHKKFEVGIKSSDIPLDERQILMRKWISRILFDKKPVENCVPGHTINKSSTKNKLINQS